MAKSGQPLGARIKARRQAMGWSREHLAERAGVHVGTVQNWETRPKPLALQNLEAIATALNTTPQDLAGWTEEGEGK